MKIHKLIITLISLQGLKSLTSTRIEPTSNEILFKPLGNLIPELSWATVRTKIDITDMFKETEELCRAAIIVDKEYVRMGNKHTSRKTRIKVSPSNINNIQAYLVEILAEDIHQMCTQNSIRIQEIIDVYNLKKIAKSKNINQIIPTIIREVRQVVVGSIIAAVGVMTSLVSIFTSNELMSMSSADDTDNELIDNSNNIIKTLQSHENAINRNEDAIKEMKENIDKLENTISLEKRVTDAYIGLFAIKLFGATTTQHLERMQDGLYQLLKNRLSPKLVPLTKLQPIISKLRSTARKRGYELGINSPSDVYMCQTSFVAYETGQLVVLSHIPMYKTKHLMKLLEYQPTPIILSNQTQQQLFIKPPKPIIAVDEDLTLYSVYTEEEIYHDCWAIHNTHYCKNKNILTRVSHVDCTLALYKKDKKTIRERCSLEVSAPHEVIIQLNSTSFYTYTPNQTDLFINCHGSKQEKIRIVGFNIISLTPGCRSSLNQHVFTSGVEIEDNIILKQNNLNLHLRDLIKVQEYEETEFLKLIEEEQDKTRKPIDIVDVSKKFHLKQLSKKSKLNTIFGTSSTVITIIVLVISAILLQRFCAKKYGRTKNNVTHFNRINEHILLREDPISMRQVINKGTSNVQTQSEISNETTTTTDAAEPSGTPINLSSIIRTVSS